MVHSTRTILFYQCTTSNRGGPEPPRLYKFGDIEKWQQEPEHPAGLADGPAWLVLHEEISPLEPLDLAGPTVL